MSSAYRQGGSYIPDDDFGIASWMRNFATKIAADPGRFGLSKADGTVAMNAYTSFQQAFDLTRDPEMRTPALIAQKDALRAAGLGTMRIFARLIRTNMGVDNQDLVGLGMKPRNHARRPIPAPRSAPIIAVRGVYSLEHVMTYQDESTSTSRRKPFGVAQLCLYWIVVRPGEPVASVMPGPENAKDMKIITRTPFTIKHRPEDAGCTAVYQAQWLTMTGLRGPWSTPCWFTIAAGGNVSDLKKMMKNPAADQIPLRKAA